MHLHGAPCCPDASQPLSPLPQRRNNDRLSLLHDREDRCNDWVPPAAIVHGFAAPWRLERGAGGVGVMWELPFNNVLTHHEVWPFLTILDRAALPPRLRLLVLAPLSRPGGCWLCNAADACADPSVCRNFRPYTPACEGSARLRRGARTAHCRPTTSTATAAAASLPTRRHRLPRHLQRPLVRVVAADEAGRMAEHAPRDARQR